MMKGFYMYLALNKTIEINKIRASTGIMVWQKPKMYTINNKVIKQ